METLEDGSIWRAYVVKLCYNARICWLRARWDDRSDYGGAGFEEVDTGR